MITWVGNQFDTTLFSYTGHVVGQLFIFLTPIALTWMTIKVLLFGYRVLYGGSNEPVLEFTKEMVICIVIVGFATIGAIYHEFVVDVFNTLTLDVVKHFALPGSLVRDAPNLWAAVQTYYDQSSLLVTQTVQGSVFDGVFYVSLLAVLFFAIGNAFFLLAAMVIILMTKGFGSFVLAIGPIFILFLLLEQTRQWFVNWLGTVFGLAVLTWLALFLLGFSLFLQEKIISAIAANLGVVNTLTQAIIYCVLCAVFGVMLWSSPAFVHGLTGGAAAQMGVQMVAQIYYLLTRRKAPQQPSPNPGGNSASRSHGWAYRAGSAVGSLTGVQWGFQRLAAAGRGRHP